MSRKFQTLPGGGTYRQMQEEAASKINAEVRERVEAQENAGILALDAILEQLEADDAPEVTPGTVRHDQVIPRNISGTVQ